MTKFAEWKTERKARLVKLDELLVPDATAEARKQAEDELAAINETDAFWEARHKTEDLQAQALKAKDLYAETKEIVPESVEVRSHAAELRRIAERGGQFKLELRHAEREAELLRQGYKAKDLVEQRAQEIKTDGKGGYLVPTDLERTVYHQMLAQPGVRYAGAQVMRTSEGNDKNLPIIARPKKSGTLETAEGASVTAVDFTTSLITLGAYKYSAMHDVTSELLQDTAINIEAEVSGSFSWQFANATNQRYTNGTGTAMPKGVLNGITASSANAITAKSKANISYVDLNQILYNLDPGYYSPAVDAFVESRRGSSFMMHPTTYANILAAVGTDGHTIFPIAQTMMQPRQLLGYPVVFNVEYPVIDASKAVITFGSMYDHYIIRDAGSIVVAVSPHSRFAEGIVQFRADIRTDGTIRDADAVRHLVTPA